VGAVSIPTRLSFGPLSSKRLLALASDDTLVEQICRGNEAAFSVAFERHAAGLLGFCRHLVGSIEEAEDAVQHTFVAAFRHLPRRRHRQLALKPWLYAIARNRCLSTLRSRREHTALDFDLPTEALTEQVERHAELRNLLRDLRELPEEQRAALLLTQAGDLTHAEVAHVLGCEVANVKALVFRARNGLIQRRAARETACEEIREQLANLRGNSLRRSALRHHLRSCAGCRAYREQVKRQRGLLAAALPMVPSLELRSSVLAASGLGGGSLGGGLAGAVGTGLSASLGAGTVVKVAAVGLLVGGAVTSGKALLAHAERPLPLSQDATARDHVSSAPKPSAGRVVAGRPAEPRTAGGRADSRAEEQESGAAQTSAAGPDGERTPEQEGNAEADPSTEAAPGGKEANGREGDADTVSAAPDTVGSAPGDRGRNVAPPASSAPDGGRPSRGSGHAGPPAGDPAHPRPPAGDPAHAGPPAGNPARDHPPAGDPAHAGPPQGSGPGQGALEPGQGPEQRPPTPARDPVTVTTPKPAPASPPPSAQSPPGAPGRPGG
jgi:RNA polymerase sigma factor (sigma-70 family)